MSEVKRAAGKKLIGAQASQAIWNGVDRWLEKNPRKSVTDFILEACMEKLDVEKIPYDRDMALFDGRRHVPSFALNDQANSAKALEVAHSFVESKLSAAEQSAAAKSPSVKTRRKARAVPPPAAPET